MTLKNVDPERIVHLGAEGGRGAVLVEELDRAASKSPLNQIKS